MIWQALSDGFSILSAKWAVVLGAMSVLCLGVGFSLFVSKGFCKEKSKTWQPALVLSVFFGISLILRLAYLTVALVPPYFDSVEHYRIINQLVTALGASSALETLPTLTPSYYHLGFHFLASLLALVLRTDPMDVILVLGQVFLAAIPVPIFVLIRHETQSDAAALLGMLLAGFGWYMPGFAVNWGKYPALAGLLSLEIVLGSAYLVAQRKSRRNELLIIGWLILGSLLSALFHTRTLVIIVISILSWLIAGKARTLPKRVQYLLLGVWLAGLLVFGTLIWVEPLLNLALDPYLGNGLWVTLTAMALSFFAFTKFPRGFYFSLLFILGVFAALFIPVGIPSPWLENQTLLDRPYAEMALYLPLSILAGLGLASTLQTIAGLDILSDKIRSYARILLSIFVVGFVGIILLVGYNFYPSECCNFVAYDDTVALDWIDRNLSPDARILVAATELNVLPAGTSGDLVGTDAGIWIPALAGRTVFPTPFDSDFRSTSTREGLCQAQIDYVYVGSTVQGFNAMQLSEKAEWYRRILFLPSVQLYQVIGCS